MGSVLPKTREQRARRWPEAVSRCRDVRRRRHALQMFFESLPDDVDAAFVVVVHLDPGRQSELSNILGARTKMLVAQVSGLTPINRATSMSSRPTGSYARPIIIWRLPSSTSLASSGRRSIFSFARLPRRAATTSPSFFPAPALMARWASRPSRRRAASSWSRTLTRPNTDPCPAAPSRQVARILFCRCANSRPASRTDPRSEESAVRRSRRNGRGGDAAHSLPFARSIRARPLELQKVNDWPSHRAQNAGAARPDNGGLSRNPA